MKIVVVVQARTGSSRLPNKIMMDLAGKPLLQRQLERIQSVKTEIKLVVATTTDSSDDPVRKLCQELGIDCFSGHPTDLLDRHYQAARPYQPDAVVKIPSDCPLIDPHIIDKVLRFFIYSNGEYDFVSNLHPATWPDGNDVEVMTFPALETAWKEAKKDFEREHTTPFFWENPDKFRIGNVIWTSGQDLSMSHRFTIDYPEDYDFIKAIYDELCWPGSEIFGLDKILALLEEKPDLYLMNSKYAGVNWYRHHLDELKTISAEKTRFKA
ncbi:MAG: glycosyltransferase family protein [Bacteroidetes bacterium]|nr:glycosyltransferase family protein [Bacteroidota bacterium]